MLSDTKVVQPASACCGIPRRMLIIEQNVFRHLFFLRATSN